jgi:ribosome-binding protein aMBF1 (putative translation factor)
MPRLDASTARMCLLTRQTRQVERSLLDVCQSAAKPERADDAHSHRISTNRERSVFDAQEVAPQRRRTV